MSKLKPRITENGIDYILVGDYYIPDLKLPEEHREVRDFLAENHITNVATDSYTLDWSRKSISITAYAQTKAQSRLIDEYIERSLLKCKRVIRKN